MELFLKIGNQNMFFIFVENQKILKVFVIPSYITINKDGKITSFGPYSFLQYIILKQLYKIYDYPLSISNRKDNKHFDFIVIRLIDNNIIQNYKDFWQILNSVFSNDLERFYNLTLMEDYEKYSIPYFIELDDFYNFLRQTKLVRWISFIPNNSSYFINQMRFLKDVFRYWKMEFYVLPFWEFFYIFYPKMVNIYIAEVNSFVWVINRYGFVKNKRIGISLRKIKEMLYLRYEMELKYIELERLALSLLSGNKFEGEISEYIDNEIIFSISELAKGLPVAVVEDLYDNLNSEGLNYFNSVNLRNNDNFDRFLKIFESILIKEKI